MGGNITINSCLGVGTTFKFDIKVRLAPTPGSLNSQSPRKAIGLAPGQPSQRILIAEDNAVSRLLLVKMLTSLGFQVREVDNGKEAVNLWEVWHPHLIWMDMQMPIMDGYEATRQIKAKEQEKFQSSKFKVQSASLFVPEQPETIASRTVIIALTASAFEEERSTILSSGCDDFVSKPFRKEVILNKMAEHLDIRYVFEEDRL